MKLQHLLNFCVIMNIVRRNDMCKGVAKPFLKWAGGKGQLLNKFEEMYPEELINGDIDTYIEPFIGGGAVFFDVLQKYKVKKAVIIDLNKELINCYRCIKADVNQLIHSILQNEFLALSEKDRKEYFLKVRDNYNTICLNGKYDFDKASNFIFLNRTCFNGLYRVNSKGLFNVPFGKYKNPLICDVENLQAISKLLQNVEIKYGDYSLCKEYINEKTFVYFDPPYRPLLENKSFVNYDKNGLSLLTKSNVGTVIIKTGVFFRENERYSMFVYIDNCDVYIYVNGKCVKHSVNTNAFYKDATYLHVGAGVLVNSYVPMTLHDFKLINKTLENKKEVDEMLPSLMTSEDEKLNATVIAKDIKKEDFSFRIKNKENYFLAGAIASYAVSAVAFTFIPVSFGIYGYNNFIYQENLSRHNNAIYQSELDLYYKEMQRSSFNANMALTSGIVLIPVCAATLTSGIILTVIYQKLKIEHLPKVAFGYTPNQACIVQFSMSL